MEYLLKSNSMRKTFTIFILSFFCVSAILYGNSKNENSPKPEAKYNIPLGDPFILYHDNMYYAYGTQAEDGIVVYTSSDLQIWKKQSQLALHKNDSYAERWFWAPEIYYLKDKKKFLMYYSADEHICAAMSDSPLGPFTQEIKKPMYEANAIDNSLFIDDDGKAYMSFVRFVDGKGVSGNSIWMVELESDLMTIKKETLSPSFHVTEAWENVWPRVVEAPFIVKYENKYYMTYSANNYESPFYGVGYAIADSPMGPWEKYGENPILQNNDSLQGVGHSAMFMDKGGKMKIAFHSHFSDTNIHPRLMYIKEVNFTNDEIPKMEITGKLITPKTISWSLQKQTPAVTYQPQDDRFTKNP